MKIVLLENIQAFQIFLLKKILFFKCVEKIILEFKNSKDQILVQEFIKNPNISGVIFTRETNYNSPYYLINYDKSGQTDIITSGKKSSINKK